MFYWRQLTGFVRRQPLSSYAEDAETKVDPGSTEQINGMARLALVYEQVTEKLNESKQRTQAGQKNDKTFIQNKQIVLLKIARDAEQISSNDEEHGYSNRQLQNNENTVDNSTPLLKLEMQAPMHSTRKRNTP